MRQHAFLEDMNMLSLYFSNVCRSKSKNHMFLSKKFYL